MSKDLTHLASRAFNTPLLMHPEKLETVLGVLTHKIETGEILIEEGLSKSDKRYTVTSDGVAIIPVFGSLVNRGLTFGPFSGMTSYEYIRNSVEDAVTDPKISSVILDIDSGGGEADGAFDLSDFIFSARGIKPIVASVSGMAASAAYAIASAADKIVSTRTAVTGSIGVIAAHRDISEKNKKDGVKFTIVRAGKKKALLNPMEPLTDVALTKLEQEIDLIYNMFIDTVARNRGIASELIKDTEADSFMGEASMKLGLIDEIGTPQQTLKELLSLNTAIEESIVASATNINNLTLTKEKAMSKDTDNTGADVKVVDLNSVRLEGRAEATEIVQLCQLAGKPQIAGTFLAEGKSTAEVRTLLLAEQVSEDRIEVNNRSGDALGTDYSSAASNPILKLATEYATTARQNHSQNLN